MSPRLACALALFALIGCSHTTPGSTASTSSSSAATSTGSSSGGSSTSSGTSTAASSTSTSGTTSSSSTSSTSSSSSTTTSSSTGTTGAQPPSACSPDATWFGEPLHPLASTPVDVVLGDVNGDGKLDAIAIESRGYAVLLGQGGGAFAAPVEYTLGTGNYEAVLGDWNRDGHLDLAIADEGSSQIHVLLGDGSGVFSDGDVFTTGQPFSIAAGDIDGDGLTDLVVATINDQAQLLRGLPDAGFFATPPTGSVSAPIYGGGQRLIGAADLDGSGKKTVFAVGGAYLPDGKIALFDAAPDGGGLYALGEIDLSADGGSGTPQFIRGVLAGDMNGDGLNDLVAIDSPFGGPYVATSIAIAAGLGNRTFAHAERTDVSPTAVLSPGSYSFALGDLDGDGHLDVLIGGATYQNSYTPWTTVLYGGPSGRKDVYATYGLAGAALGDLNGDGQLDAVFVRIDDLSRSGSAQAILNDGAGGLATWTAIGPVTNPSRVSGSGYPAVGDFNGDGRDDLALGVINQSYAMDLFLGVDGGTFGPSTSLFPGFSGSQLQAQDVTRDGKLDLVASGFGFAGIFPGAGDGTFGAPEEIVLDAGTWPGPHGIIFADVVGGPELDLVGAAYHTPGLVVAEGFADGGFGAPQLVATPIAPTEVAALDVDLDGKTDVIACGDAGVPVLELLHNDGDGGFTGVASLVVGGCGELVVAQLDGSGAPSLLVDGTHGFDRVDWPASGQPSLAAYDGGYSALSLGTADLSRTGRPAVIDDTGSALLIFPQLPDGGFSTPVSYPLNGSSRSAAPIDANGDGFPDLVVGDTQYGSALLLNRCR